jgi:hydrogenase maturation protease
MSSERCVVVGVGNRFRRDDSAGLYVAERLQDYVPDGVEVLTLEGEPTTLLDVFASAELVILVDAVATATVPGLIQRFDATDEQVPGSVFGASTHAFGLGETIELARTLGKLNGRILVYGITGEDFDAGEGLSASVAKAAERVTLEIVDRLAELVPQTAEPNGANRA